MDIWHKHSLGFAYETKLHYGNRFVALIIDVTFWNYIPCFHIQFDSAGLRNALWRRVGGNDVMCLGGRRLTMTYYDLLWPRILDGIASLCLLGTRTSPHLSVSKGDNSVWCVRKRVCGVWLKGRLPRLMDYCLFDFLSLLSFLLLAFFLSFSLILCRVFLQSRCQAPHFPACLVLSVCGSEWIRRWSEPQLKFSSSLYVLVSTLHHRIDLKDFLSTKSTLFHPLFCLHTSC